MLCCEHISQLETRRRLVDLSFTELIDAGNHADIDVDDQHIGDELPFITAEVETNEISVEIYVLISKGEGISKLEALYVRDQNTLFL